jgi:hypothetical protein
MGPPLSNDCICTLQAHIPMLFYSTPLRECYTSSNIYLQVPTVLTTPCLEKMWRTNSFASMTEVIVSYIGMNRDCLVKWSTITIIVTNLTDGGSFSMKSMEMEFQGCSGIGSCFIVP